MGFGKQFLKKWPNVQYMDSNVFKKNLELVFQSVGLMVY